MLRNYLMRSDGGLIARTEFISEESEGCFKKMHLLIDKRRLFSESIDITSFK